jgi:hypothetical protein
MRVRSRHGPHRGRCPRRRWRRSHRRGGWILGQRQEHKRDRRSVAERCRSVATRCRSGTAHRRTHRARTSYAAAVVLRSNDFYGPERAPFPVGSRLLYVVLTRARLKTIVLLFGHEPPALVAPLSQLASRRATRPGGREPWPLLTIIGLAVPSTPTNIGLGRYDHRSPAFTGAAHASHDLHASAVGAETPAAPSLRDRVCALML